MKNNAGSPKKRPKRRHKKKQTKSRKRSLQQRLARMAKIRQALAAIRSDNHSPMVEPEPEKPLPTPTRGKPLWDVTINSVDAPHCFGIPRPQLPPKSPDRVTIRLPSRAMPFTVADALSYQPAVLRLRSSTGVLVLLSAELCDPSPEPPTQHPRFAPALWSSSLAIVMPGLPPPRLLEPPPEQPLPYDWPPLPHLPPPGRVLVRLESLKELTRAVIAGNTSSEDQVLANKEEDSVRHEVIFRKRLQENKFKLSLSTKPSRKKAGFIRKAYRPDKRRFSHKSIGSLKKQHSGLSDSRQPRRYATKTPRLSRAAGKALLTKRVKLLAPEIKQNSEIFTPASPAAGPMKQESSVAHSPDKKPLKAVYPAVIADQLQNVKKVFDKKDVKHQFRKFFGLRKTTSGPEWEFHEAESLFFRLFKWSPKLKRTCLEESGCVPEGIFRMISTEIAQYNQPDLTQQEYIMRDLWAHFLLEMASFNQLVQSLAFSGPPEPGTLDSPADPPGKAVTTSLLISHPEWDHSFNNDY